MAQFQKFSLYLRNTFSEDKDFIGYILFLVAHSRNLKPFYEAIKEGSLEEQRIKIEQVSEETSMCQIISTAVIVSRKGAPCSRLPSGR